MDTGEVMAVWDGVVKNNDIVWVGTVPNMVPKLSALRQEVLS